MDDAIEERLAAVERALTDGEGADGLPDAARMDARVDDLEATVADVDDRLADLEAAVEALRGFAGGIRAVDEAVERRANAAAARVERLETDLREVERSLADARGRNETGGDGTAADASDPDEGSSDGDGVWHSLADEPGHPADGSRVERSDREERTARNGRVDETSGWRSLDRDPASTRPTDASLAEAAAAVARDEVDGDPTADRADDSDSSLADRLRRLL